MARVPNKAGADYFRSKDAEKKKQKKLVIVSVVTPLGAQEVLCEHYACIIFCYTLLCRALDILKYFA